jgi:hypothetical protein
MTDVEEFLRSRLCDIEDRQDSDSPFSQGQKRVCEAALEHGRDGLADWLVQEFMRVEEGLEKPMSKRVQVLLLGEKVMLVAVADRISFKLPSKDVERRSMPE